MPCGIIIKIITIIIIDIMSITKIIIIVVMIIIIIIIITKINDFERWLKGEPSALQSREKWNQRRQILVRALTLIFD